MSRHFTPLDVCIALIAPLKDLGEIGGVNPKSAYNWRAPSSWRAAGDMPVPVMRRLLAHSETNGLGVEARWLICGATRDQVEAALAARGLSAEQSARLLMERGLGFAEAAE